MQQIVIGGCDRTAELLEPMAGAVRAMEERKDSVFLPEHVSALRLACVRSGTELALEYARLIRYSQHVDPGAFCLPPPRGAKGRVMHALRMVLWKVLRYQHERMFFRQNLVNSHLTGLLELQARELRLLRSEVDQLRVGKGPPGS